MNAAIVVGVGTFADRAIREISFAVGDAIAFASALQQAGSKAENCTLLTAHSATKTAVESVLRTVLKFLGATDSLTLYFVGHGFANLAGDNFLACFDTRVDDAEFTSVDCRWLLDQLCKSRCGKIVLFADVWHGPLTNAASWSREHVEFVEQPLQEYIASTAKAACFVSCSPGEVSQAGRVLERSVWSNVITTALAGERQAALDGRQLTAASLQKVLLADVSASLREINPGAQQTPQSFAIAPATFVVAELPRSASIAPIDYPAASQVKDSILLSQSVQSAKKLTGFAKSKGHSLPDRCDARSQAFLAEVATEDLQSDIEGIRAALKQAFGFKRTQLSVASPDLGSATITTPHFNYNVNLEQSTADPANVVWRRTIDAIRKPEVIVSDPFETVFGSVFDTVELTLHHTVDLEALIDTIEALDSKDLEISYADEANVESCVIHIAGTEAAIRVTARTFSLVHPRAMPPRRLLRSLSEVQHLLTRSYPLVAISFELPSA